MNILVVTPIYYIKDRLNLFHDSSAIHYLIRPWAKEHNVTVINIYSQPIGKIVRYKSKKERDYYKNGYHFQDDGVDVHMCEIQRWYKQKAILSPSQTRRVIKFIKTVMPKNEKPDVIVAHMPTSCLDVLDGIYPGVKKVAVLHQTDVINCSNDVTKCERINSIFSKIFARSKNINSFCQSKAIRVERDLIYSGVPIKMRAVNGKIKPDKYHVVYVGKLIKRKNVDKCILCMQKMNQNVCFDIYGEGPEKSKLEQLAASNEATKTSVRFHGQISHDKVADIMADSDIFVMVSTGETFGLVYLEAMALGDIVIASRHEGIDGVVVDGKNGFLVDPNNLDELVQCMDNIFNLNDADYTEISRNANLTAMEFTEEKMGRKYLSMICS